MRRFPRRTRYALWSALGVVALVASGVIVWRVLAPAEVVTKAVADYPSPAVAPAAGPLGALISAPLIVDDTLRVYASQRQVQADDQPAYRFEKSPYWSFRRWPQQLIAVVHPQTRTTGGVPLVVSSWSDGALIALDARTGEVAWRSAGASLGEAYPGRRTGSAVVWNPTGLLTGLSGGRSVVVIASGAHLLAFDAATGARLWEADGPDGACGAEAFTVPGALLVPGSCGGAQVMSRVDLLAGAAVGWEYPGFTAKAAVTPLGCRVGRSECGGARLAQSATRTSSWIWPAGAGEPTEARGLSGNTAWLATDDGGTATMALDAPLGDTADTFALTGRDPVTGALRWTWSRSAPGDATSAQVIATTPERVLLLTKGRTLITLDPASGREISRVSVILDHEPERPYAVGPVFAAGPFVAIERHNVAAEPSGTDDEYYYTNRPILLAAS